MYLVNEEVVPTQMLPLNDDGIPPPTPSTEINVQSIPLPAPSPSPMSFPMGITPLNCEC